MPALVDTNVLVYRVDSRYPDKQKRAGDLLRSGIADNSLRLAHQAIAEFVASVTRIARSGKPLLRVEHVRHHAEQLLDQFEILYPTEGLVRLALRGAAAYELSWWDAHMWAYAEFYGCETLWSEDFQHGRKYGTVTVVNPFRE